MNNPEQNHKKEEKRKTDLLYDDDGYSKRLYPGTFFSGAASATESTGLIQTVPLTPGMMEVYDDIYSYRRTEPAANEEEE